MFGTLTHLTFFSSSHSSFHLPRFLNKNKSILINVFFGGLNNRVTPNLVSQQSTLPIWESCNDGVGVKDLSNAAVDDGVETSVGSGMVVDTGDLSGLRIEKSDTSHITLGSSEKESVAQVHKNMTVYIGNS